MNEKPRCEMCHRESAFLVPILSKKKGYEGWKMVCRICYERISEVDNESQNKIK